MKRITYPSENINTWNNKIKEDITRFELECSACSSLDNFSSPISSHHIWRWEIHIPYDWEYSQWEDIQLYNAKVQILLVKCNVCDEKYSIYPSFIVKGTTLTLSALIFIAFAYESSDLTWRELPEKFCQENDKITHSTLYKAVHGLGENINRNEKAKNELEKLTAKHLPVIEDPASNWPPPKSLYPHTITREQGVRKSLGLLIFWYATSRFITLFYHYLRHLSRVISILAPPSNRLYHNRHIITSPPRKSETQKAG